MVLAHHNKPLLIIVRAIKQQTVVGIQGWP